MAPAGTTRFELELLNVEPSESTSKYCIVVYPLLLRFVLLAVFDDGPLRAAAQSLSEFGHVSSEFAAIVMLPVSLTTPDDGKRCANGRSAAAATPVSDKSVLAKTSTRKSEQRRK